MKDIKIELNTSNASGEAYWRKRCDTVEAKLARLRAEMHRADIALSESPFHGQEELAEASLADGIRNYRSAVEAELARLRAEVETLVWNLGGISTLACRREVMDYDTKEARPALSDVAKLVQDYVRLRAVNAELVEALEKLARLGNGSEYGNSDGNMIARAALSRAEQAKPETCVWTYEAAWVSGCGLQYINAVIDADMQFCPFCGKRVEVKG